jgi:hypothetical protein
MGLSRSFQLAFCFAASLFPLTALAYPSHDTSYPNPNPNANETSKQEPSHTDPVPSATTHWRMPYALYTHLASANTHNGSPTNSNTLSNGAKGGIGIGVSLVILALFTTLLIHRHKKREKERLRNRYRSMEHWAAQQNQMAYSNTLSSPREWWDKEYEDLRTTKKTDNLPTRASSSATPASSVKLGRESNTAVTAVPGEPSPAVPAVSEPPKAVVNGTGTVKER